MLLNSLYVFERLSFERLQFTSLVLFERIAIVDTNSVQKTINRIPLLKNRFLGSFASDYVPILSTETFAVRNTRSSIMQVEHWMMIANSCQNMCFQTLSGVKFTASSSNTTSRWCQSHSSPTPMLVASTRYMQLFIY